MCIFLITLLILHKFEWAKLEKKIQFNYSETSIDNYAIDDLFDYEEEETKENFPFLVSLQFMNVHKCGGTLISTKFVLTAGHCLIKFDQNRNMHREESKNYRVIAGVKNLNQYNAQINCINVKKTYLHPYFYTDGLIFHDIGLVELESQNSTQEFIKLANRIQIESSLKSKSRTECTIAGWGKSKHNAIIKYTPYLQSAKIFLTSSRSCQKSYPAHYYMAHLQLCAYKPGVDTCNGDSGGPLICNGVQYGIISFGIGCADNFPSVHTRVDAYQSWITGISGVSMSIVIKNKIINLIFCLIMSIFVQHIP